MYWDRSQGPFIESHNSHGLYRPALRWGTGDSRVGGVEGYQSFLLLGNPTGHVAHLRITYHPDGREPIVTKRSVGGGLRDNLHVNADVPQLRDTTFWATIESTNGVPVVVERSVYWNSGGQFLGGGSNVLAQPLVPASYNGCEMALSPGSVLSPASGGITRVEVGTTSRCTYVVASAVPWMTVISGASGFGIGVVEIAVAPNPSGTARTGQVIIGGSSVDVTRPAATNPTPPPPAPACAGSAPAPGWLCVTGGAWVPADHPLARHTGEEQQCRGRFSHRAAGDETGGGLPREPTRSRLGLHRVRRLGASRSPACQDRRLILPGAPDLE